MTIGQSICNSLFSTGTVTWVAPSSAGAMAVPPGGFHANSPGGALVDCSSHREQNEHDLYHDIIKPAQ